MSREKRSYEGWAGRRAVTKGGHTGQGVGQLKKVSREKGGFEGWAGRGDRGISGQGKGSERVGAGIGQL